MNDFQLFVFRSIRGKIFYLIFIMIWTLNLQSEEEKKKWVIIVLNILNNTNIYAFNTQNNKEKVDLKSLANHQASCIMREKGKTNYETSGQLSVMINDHCCFLQSERHERRIVNRNLNLPYFITLDLEKRTASIMIRYVWN